MQGGIANSPFGVVVLDKKGVQNSKQHGISRIKSASFAAVKDVLEKGIIILPLDNYGTNNKKEMTGMIAAPIQIGEEKYVCVVEVIANLEQQRLYLHESFLTKNLQEVVASNSVHGNNVNASSPQPQGEIAKVLQNFLISKQNNKNNIKETKYMKKKQTIRLNEAQLRQIVKESVKRTMKEGMSREEVNDTVSRLLVPYRKVFNESICEELESSFKNYIYFYGLDRVKDIMEEWLEGRAFTIAKRFLDNYGDNNNSFGINYVDMLRSGHDFDHSTM